MRSGAQGRVVLGPYIQPAGTDLSGSLTVVWWSDAPGDGLLEWADPEGKTGGELPSEQTPYQGWVRHTARLERPGDATAIRVLASVTVGGAKYSGPARTFEFAPRRGELLRFAALGDTGAGTQAQRAVVNGIRNQKASVVLITGDVAYDHGNWDEYQRRFFPYYDDLMREAFILPALGNHDVGNPDHMGQPFRMVWTPPDNWAAPPDAGPYSLRRARSNRSEGPVPAGQDSLRNYSTDAAYCHFVALDSTADRATMETQIVPWLEADLAGAKARGQKWLIAYWHHAPYTRGAYRTHRNQWGDIRDLYLPVLRRYGVRLVLLGHDHNFQHMEVDGIHYVVTGAGGAGLHRVHPEYDGNGQPPLIATNDAIHSYSLFEQSAAGATLTARQIDRNGRELASWTITAYAGGVEGAPTR